MEVNSLTLVEVMCYAQDDSFGIPVVSSSTQCFRSSGSGLSLRANRNESDKTALDLWSLGSSKNVHF